MVSGKGSDGASGDCSMYGIVASEKGAVRSINCVDGKVVTVGEDGNVLVFDYGDVGGGGGSRG